MRIQKSTRGTTILELAIGLTIFSLLGILLAVALRQGSRIWVEGLSSSDAQTELRKAYGNVYVDLKATQFDDVAVTAVPGSLSGGGNDSDAVWFLSAEDPATGEVIRKSDGSPFWQRNILYYAAVPSNHQSMYGFTCEGGSDANGYDDRCPHKILIRQVIDAGQVTNPTDESTEETLLTSAEIQSYLGRPGDLNLAGVSGPNTERVDLIASKVQYFRVQLEPVPDVPGEVRVDLRTTKIQQARKEVRLGTDHLGPYSIGYDFSVFPAEQANEP